MALNSCSCIRQNWPIFKILWLIDLANNFRIFCRVCQLKKPSNWSKSGKKTKSLKLCFWLTEHIPRWIVMLSIAASKRVNNYYRRIRRLVIALAFLSHLPYTRPTFMHNFQSIKFIIGKCDSCGRAGQKLWQRGRKEGGERKREKDNNQTTRSRISQQSATENSSATGRIGYNGLSPFIS